MTTSRRDAYRDALVIHAQNVVGHALVELMIAEKIGPDDLEVGLIAGGGVRAICSIIAVMPKAGQRALVQFIRDEIGGCVHKEALRIQHILDERDASDARTRTLRTRDARREP